MKDKQNISIMIRNRIESSGERFWRFNDFENLPFTALAQVLSRLCRQGVIQRVGKGLYYKPRQTTFGQSKLNTSLLRSLPILNKAVFPAGIAAANLLGVNTQNAAWIEVATNGLSLPRLIVGEDTIIHTRRPDAWKELSKKEAAILDFLRRRGETSELSPKKTLNKLLEHFKDPGLFEHLLQVANSEPPRVRAMLGAIGQEIGCSEDLLINLRKSLNPLSKFDFGNLNILAFSKHWQAKEQKTRETL